MVVIGYHQHEHHQHEHHQHEHQSFVNFETGRQLWDGPAVWHDCANSFCDFQFPLDNGYEHRSGFVKDLSGLRKINIASLASQNGCLVNDSLFIWGCKGL